MDHLRRPALTFALLLLVGCGGAPPATSATASDATTSAGSDGHSSTSATAGASSTSATAGSSSTGGTPCAADDACEPTEFCRAGGCESLCGLTEDIVIPITEPKIALVIDTSNSMLTADVDHDGDPNTPPITRWRLLREGFFGPMGESDLSAQWAALRVTASDASQGYDAGACAVDPAPALPLEDALSVAELVAMLPPADADGALLRGARPLRGALEAAYAHLRASADGLPAVALLFTAGAANCAAGADGVDALLEGADEGVVDVVADALADGIPTIVVGVSLGAEPTPDAVDMEPDGVSPADFVATLAVAGGYPNSDPDAPYFPLDLLADGAPLATMLFGSEGTPGFGLSHPVPPAMTLEVTFDGVIQPALPKDASCAASDGWIFGSVERDLIWFCGATGALAREGAEGLVTYVCP